MIGRQMQTKTSNKKSLAWTVLASALAAAVAIGAAPQIASADAAACGATGQPPCPLQKWMRANLGTAQTNGDASALAAGLTKTAAFNPDPTWTDWVKMSNDGAAAAGKGDIAGAKASCNACHQKYKADYKAKYRTKAVP